MEKDAWWKECQRDYKGVPGDLFRSANHQDDKVLEGKKGLFEINILYSGLFNYFNLSFFITYRGTNKKVR